MTISSEGNINTYAGDGADTTFEFTFPILDESHLEVEVVNDSTGVVTTKTLTTHYTVSGSGNTSGSTDYTSGTVTFGTAPASGETVVLRYDVPITQAVDLQENDNFPAETIEDSLDKLSMIDAMQQEQIDNSIRINSGEDALTSTVITGVPTANYIVQVNDSGDGLEFAANSGGGGGGGGMTSFTLAGDSGTSSIVDSDTLTIAGGTGITTSVSADTATITYSGTVYTDESIQDLVGAMTTGNTETGITVTYQDADGTIDFVVSDLTFAGDSGSTGLTMGDTVTIAGGTNCTTAMSGDTLTVNVDDAFLSNSGDTGTGAYDFGGATSFELPNSATPTVNADGQIAIDTTVTDFSHGIIKYYSGEEMAVVAVPVAQLTSPTDTYVIKYNATNDEFELAADAGAGGGISNVVEDTTPQLGGQLDVNGNAIGDGTNELLSFSETASAVNHVEITNATTGGTPVLSGTGDDTNVDFIIDTKGTGTITIGSADTTTNLAGTAISGNCIKDEDNMVSDSATHLATQQSIKAYADTKSDASKTETFTNKTMAYGSNTFTGFPYDVAFVAGYDSTFVKENLAVQTYAKIVMTKSGSITDDIGAIETAPTGAALIMDIEKNGTTVYSTKPQFAASSSTFTGGTLKTDGTEDFVAGDVLTFKVTQVGSTEPGEGLTFTLDCELT